jgi:hypothetical protein
MAVSQNEPVFPTVLRTPRVTVTLRDGEQLEIENPLYDYGFHPLDNRQINSTVRKTSYFHAILSDKSRAAISATTALYATPRREQFDELRIRLGRGSVTTTQ